MANFANLPSSTINAEQRAIRAWLRIQRRPSTVQFIRNGAALPEQTVRIEIGDQLGKAMEAPSGAEGEQNVIIYGVVGHPTVTDTDMKRLDRIIIGGKNYVIDTVVEQPGEIQGSGKATR